MSNDLIVIEKINAYDVIIERLNTNIKYLKAHPKILDKEEHQYLYPVFEKAMYIGISASDLIISLKYLELSNVITNQCEAVYFSRNVALISYELISHQKKIVGHEVSKVIINQVGEMALSELKDYTKDLKDIHKDYSGKLSYIRNNLFAHRTENGSEMASSMLNVDPVEIYQIGKKIFDSYIGIFKVYINFLHKL